VRVDDVVSAIAGEFDDFPQSPAPRNPRFAEVHAAVENLAQPNNLALANAIASLVEPNEWFVEVGSFHGASLIGALLGNETRAVAIDSFAHPDASREELEQNLERFGVRERVEILVDDAFALLREGALDGKRVGAYYYDAAHDYDSQLQALRLVEPFLAERAVPVVDDSDWERVARATRNYLASQPRASLLLEIAGRENGQPWWWEGVQVLAWDGTP
jgi:predicted O-methyltransferase YrrM